MLHTQLLSVLTNDEPSAGLAESERSAAQSKGAAGAGDVDDASSTPSIPGNGHEHTTRYGMKSPPPTARTRRRRSGLGQRQPALTGRLQWAGTPRPLRWAAARPSPPRHPLRFEEHLHGGVVTNREDSVTPDAAADHIPRSKSGASTADLLQPRRAAVLERGCRRSPSAPWRVLASSEWCVRQTAPRPRPQSTWSRCRCCARRRLISPSSGSCGGGAVRGGLLPAGRRRVMDAALGSTPLLALNLERFLRHVGPAHEHHLVYCSAESRGNERYDRVGREDGQAGGRARASEAQRVLGSIEQSTFLKRLLTVHYNSRGA